MIKNICYSIFLVFIFQQFSSAQSPWVNNKGSYYTQVSLTTIGYSSAFDQDGNVRQLLSNVLDQTYAGFIDYSVNDRLALSSTLPFKRVRFDGDQLATLGDIDLAARFQLIKDAPFTIYGKYTLPTATQEGPLRTGFQVNAIESGFSFGRSRTTNYSSISAGYRLRNNIPDQVIIGAEIGTSSEFGKVELLLAFRIDGAINTSGPAEIDILAEESNLHSANGQFLSPGVKLGVKLQSGISFNFGAYGAFFAKNQGAAPSVNLGIAYSVNK